MKLMKALIRPILFLLSASFFLAACGEPVKEDASSVPDDPGPLVAPETFSERSYEDSVIKVSFTGPAATVNLKNLKDNDIYLVKLVGNTTIIDIIPAKDTGGASGYSGLSGAARVSGVAESAVPDSFMCGTGKSRRLIPETLMSRSSYSGTRALRAPKKLGDTWMVWGYFYDYQKEKAVLRAVGTYCNIWVTEGVYGTGATKISTEIAEQIARNFDMIYPLETKAFGYEKGGGPGGNGGVDGDRKVQILVCDLTKINAGGTFWPLDLLDLNDERTVEFLANGEPHLLHLNGAEMFYIDALTALQDEAVHTDIMIHEFMHLIEESQETGRGKISWYAEMLATLAEDVIGNCVDIHFAPWYMPKFLESYAERGLTSTPWYGVRYAFGSYLVRNYGGMELIQQLLKSPWVGDRDDFETPSDMAPGLRFEAAFSRYGEALLFSGKRQPEGVLTFDKTVSKTIGGTTYTFEGMDIWEKYNSKGPQVFDLTPTEMWPFSLIAQSSDDWFRKTGNYSITLQKPANPDVEMYIMVR